MKKIKAINLMVDGRKFEFINESAIGILKFIDNNSGLFTAKSLTIFDNDGNKEFTIYTDKVSFVEYQY